MEYQPGDLQALADLRSSRGWDLVEAKRRQILDYKVRELCRDQDGATTAKLRGAIEELERDIVAQLRGELRKAGTPEQE